MGWICFPDGDRDRKSVNAKSDAAATEFHFYQFMDCCEDCDCQTKIRAQDLIATITSFTVTLLLSWQNVSLVQHKGCNRYRNRGPLIKCSTYLKKVISPHAVDHSNRCNWSITQSLLHLSHSLIMICLLISTQTIRIMLLMPFHLVL